MRGVQLLFLVFGAALATIAPFVMVMLQARGMEPAAIGFVAALSALGFTVALPVWGHLADVVLGRVRTLQIAVIGAGLVMLPFNLPVPAAALGAMVVAFNVFESALSPLLDALAVGVLADRPQDYGRVRWLSSLTWGIAIIPIGFLYNQTGYGPVPFIWFAACLLFVAVLSTIREPPRTRHAAPQMRGGSPRLALQIQPRLPIVLFVFGLAFFAILGAYTFLNLRMVDLGGTPSDVALAGGLAALAEIPGMVFGARIARRIGLRGLFFGSATLYGLCIATWVVIDRPEWIIVTRTLSGPFFAGIWVSCVLTINVLLPRGLQATGQSLFQTTAFGVGAMLADATGGIIFQEAGPPTLFAVATVVCLVAAVAGLLVLPRTGDLRRHEPDPGAGDDEEPDGVRAPDADVVLPVPPLAGLPQEIPPEPVGV